MKFLLPVFCTILVSCNTRTYNVPTSSMENTIPAGSKIVVEKGKSFAVGDIVIFEVKSLDRMLENMEDSEIPNELWVFRIVAQSGDTVQIRKGDLYVNGKLQPLPPLAKLNYAVTSTNPVKMFNEMNEKTGEWGFKIPVERKDGYIKYNVSLSANEKSNLEKNEPALVSIERLIDSTANEHLSSFDQNAGWSMDNFGPLLIPRPGDRIEIPAHRNNPFCQLDEVTKKSGILSEPLYFVMGDNRSYAADSRYTGLIPKNAIKGVVK